MTKKNMNMNMETEIWVKRMTKKDCIDYLTSHYELKNDWTWQEWEKVMAIATDEEDYDLEEAFSDYFDNCWEYGEENDDYMAWNSFIEKEADIDDSDIKAAWRTYKLDMIIETL